MRILAASARSGNDITRHFFTAADAQLFARGDLMAGNETEVRSAAGFATGDQGATLVVVDVPGGGDVASVSIEP